MNRLALSLLGVGVAILIVVAYMSFYAIYPTEQAILLQWGGPRAVETEPGLHVKIPWVQTVAFIDKRLLNVDVQSEEIATADRKQLMIDAFARWRIVDPIRFNEIAKDRETATQRLIAILDAKLRRVLGSVNLVDVLSPKQDALTRAVRGAMNAETKDFGIDVVDVRLKRVNLPQESADAVYARMQQDRRRQAAKIEAEGAEIADGIRAKAEHEATVIKADATRDADIVKGEGDAEKTRILGAAYGQDPEFFAFYRSLKAYRDALQSSNTTAVLSPDSAFFKYFQDAGGAARANARAHKP
ncbi:MAG TPA: protease modulator HflC [Rhizomicrobium sp.]|nr:protease modulator HflC [Rhizomicrobium sp.]